METPNPRKRNFDLIDGESGGSIASTHSGIEVNTEKIPTGII